MPAALTAILPTVLVVLKATAILIAALLVSLAMHRASSSSRHRVWLVALAGLLVLPLIATYVPVGVRVLPAPAAVAPTGDNTTFGNVADPKANTAITDPNGASTLGDASPTITITPPRATRTPIPLGTLLLGAWAAVMIVLLGRLALSVRTVRRIVRTATPLDDPAWQTTLFEVADRLELDDIPALLASDAVQMPFAAGVRQPVIVLPAVCSTWSRPQREAVLIHELGHIRRRDMVGHMLGRVACAIYWFHPLAWTAARRLRDASERACDDLAIRLGAVPSDYAQHLLDIVTSVRGTSTPTAAIAMARRKEFEGRMLAILDPAQDRGEPPRWRTAVVSLALTGFVIAVSAAAPIQRPAAPAAPASPMSSGLPIADPITPESVALGNVAAPAPSELPVDGARTEPLPDVDQILRDNNINVKINRPRRGEQQQAVADEKMDLLIRVLKTDSSARVRRVAAWGLEPYAAVPEAQRELAHALATDSNADVREMSAWALANGDGPTARTALETACKGDADEDVREMAVWGLGSIGGDASAMAIAAVLNGDSSERVKGTAAWAIGQMRPTRAPRALVALLESTDKETRLMAAWALSEIGDSSTLPAVSAALNRGQDEETTRALLRTLGRTGMSADSMSKFLSSASVEVRLFAIRSMSGAGRIDPWPWPWPRPIPIP